MPERGIRSPYSQCPLQVLIHDDSGIISTGTAFLYSYEEKAYLITNWHNVSGRHFLTKLPLSIDRAPLFIEIKLATNLPRVADIDSRPLTTIAKRVDIYRDFKPLWFEHPTLGPLCDVVAIPFEQPVDCAENMHLPANLIGKIRIPVKPGNTAFVIGFPKSLSVGFGLPLWKSGYIASEPFYDVTIAGSLSRIGELADGKRIPAFFIDTQTREGMSGAPVFASYVGNWDMTNPYAPLNVDSPDFSSRDDVALGEHRMEFVGCYSARIGPVEEGAALGLCWKESAIREICATQKQGKHPHINSITEAP